MLTIVSYFLCHIRVLKYKEGRYYQDVLPSGNRPAGKETLKHKTLGTISVPLKSEKAEEIYQDYTPGMLTFICFYGNRSFHSIKSSKQVKYVEMIQGLVLY